MSTVPLSKKNPWLQLLLPVVICLIFILALIGYHQHKIWIQKTRIWFTISLPESRSFDNVVVQLDGQPVISGQNISLGKHTLTVRSPKVEPFQTNFFAWYGSKNLAQISLRRAIGNLSISSTSPASSIKVVGPDFSVAMVDVAKTNLSVPTDTYQITARYPHWSQAKSVTVMAQTLVSCDFTPHLGALEITCNHDQTEFRLTDASENFVESGKTPATITGLVPGNYQLLATLNQHQQTMEVTIHDGQTSKAPFDFEFGSCVLNTTPEGANVYDANNHFLGATPLLLAERQPQTYSLSLQLSGYAAANIQAQIIANQTNYIQTNLVSMKFLADLKQAQDALADSQFAKADTAIKAALLISPFDNQAILLQRQINGQWLLQQAKDLAQNQDYIGACGKLTNALQQLSLNSDAMTLLDQYQQQIPQQIAREKAERLKQPKMVFDLEMKAHRNSDLFESHELKTSKPWKEVADSIASAFQHGQPAFEIGRVNSGQPEVFDMEAEQDFLTYLKTSAGYRRVVIVGGQVTDNETEIYYKVYEYKAEAAIKFSIGNLLGTPASVNYVPINASTMKMTDELTKRISDGVQIATSRIQEAIGKP